MQGDEGDVGDEGDEGDEGGEGDEGDEGGEGDGGDGGDEDDEGGEGEGDQSAFFTFPNLTEKKKHDFFGNELSLIKKGYRSLSKRRGFWHILLSDSFLAVTRIHKKK